MDTRKSGQITKEEIKKILLKHYGENDDSVGRILVEYSPKKEDNAKCTFFTLSGTPPKGYALYIPDHRLLCLYDNRGKRFKEYYLQLGIDE